MAVENTSPSLSNIFTIASPDDISFMRIALEEAQKAFEMGEVPVGAIAVRSGEVIARAHNRREQLQSPTAHAEILVIEETARQLRRWRLSDITIYVTLEPCPMCAGAMIQARIGRLIYGATDPKAGSAGSVVNLFANARFNHRVAVLGGVLAEECAELLQRFFNQRR